MEEVWKDISGFEGLYEISTLGRVKSLVPHNRRESDFLKLSDNGKAMQVCLFKNSKKYSIRVHTLVLETFVCLKPEGLECCHNDGNYKNNEVGNLRWDTHKSNTQDTIRHGRFVCNKGEKSGNAKLTNGDILIIKSAIKYGYTDTKISNMYPVSRRHINDIRNGKCWAHI